jgi:hypothetical protein
MGDLGDMLASGIMGGHMGTLRKALRVKVGVTLIALGLVTPAWPADLTIPITFVPDTPATSGDMNKNFGATATAVNSKQDRIQGTCATAGQAIKSVNPDGSVVCEAFATGNNRMASVQVLANSVQMLDTHDIAGAFLASRGAGSSIGVQISVTTGTTLTRISAFNEMPTRGNLRFVIFDHPGHNLLLLTNPQPFAPDATGVGSFKDSVPFSFVLVAGQSYDVGAISDVAANWGADSTFNSTPNFTSAANANFSDFNNPTVAPHGGADAQFQLYGLLP